MQRHLRGDHINGRKADFFSLFLFLLSEKEDVLVVVNFFGYVSTNQCNIFYFRLHE